MKQRPFRPGLDGDPERIAYRKGKFAISAGMRPQFFVLEHLPWPQRPSSGSKFEPAHRAIVVADFGSGRRMECRYNRLTRTFWIRFGPGDYMVSPEAPVAWEQLPPEPRPGLTADEVDEG